MQNVSLDVVANNYLLHDNACSFHTRDTGGRLNKKDGPTRYGNSHVKDKTS